MHGPAGTISRHALVIHKESAEIHHIRNRGNLSTCSSSGNADSVFLRWFFLDDTTLQSGVFFLKWEKETGRIRGGRV